ncbi:hypothetical protein [Actinomadura atramentaria]|uniref:hypothetical protein n=1 Tax=Actinomadura atramentaria TaxID=1990 RepID=UPI001F0A8F76|nr:hypothetical protein [Actinomadura atramentaria]
MPTHRRFPYGNAPNIVPPPVMERAERIDDADWNSQFGENPNHEPPEPPEPPRPVNQRVVFLEALGMTLGERYSGVSTEVARFTAGLPPILRIRWRNIGKDVGADLTHDGWTFVWGFDPRRVIGPAGDPVRAAQVIAAVLGIPERPGR